VSIAVPATGKTLNDEDAARLAQLVGANKERKRLVEVEAARLVEEEKQRVQAAAEEEARRLAEEARRVAAEVEARRQAAATTMQRVVRGFVGWCRARGRRVTKAADALRSSVAALVRLGVEGPLVVALSALAAADGAKAKGAGAPPGAASLKSKHFQSPKQMIAVGLPASNAALMVTCTGAHETAMHASN